MDKQRIIAKIKKCLALGKSCEPHEATLAMKRARELMEKHGVRADDVSLAGISCKDAFMSGARNPPRFLHYLTGMVSDVFGCDAVLTGGYDHRKGGFTNASFIGFGPVPEIAAYTFSVLNKQLVRGRKAYLATLGKRLKRSTKTRRGNLWAEAWVRAASKKAVRLSLGRDEAELIRKWKAREYGELEDAKPRDTKFMGRGDYDAVRRGIEAGLEASLNHGVDGSAAAPGRLAERVEN